MDKNEKKPKERLTMQYIIVGVIVLIIAIVIGNYILIQKRTIETDCSTNISLLIDGLNENDAILYGAEWCRYCQNQKLLFGDKFYKINYVECTTKQEICATENITLFPTWIINGDKFNGYLTQEQLAEIIGC